MDWIIPHDLETAEEIYANLNHNTELTFTEYLHDDYISSIHSCRPKIENKNKLFNKAIYLLVAGVIIIMVIKFGAPATETEGNCMKSRVTMGTKITKGA